MRRPFEPISGPFNKREPYPKLIEQYKQTEYKSLPRIFQENKTSDDKHQPRRITKPWTSNNWKIRILRSLQVKDDARHFRRLANLLQRGPFLQRRHLSLDFPLSTSTRYSRDLQKYFTSIARFSPEEMGWQLCFNPFGYFTHQDISWVQLPRTSPGGSINYTGTTTLGPGTNTNEPYTNFSNPDGRHSTDPGRPCW